MRISVVIVVAILAVGQVGAQAGSNADSVRLNNRGVAQMGQQFTDKAEDSFAAATKADPKLAQAYVNDGIALLTLQKLDDAKAALQKAIALDAKNPQAWYNLGLVQHAGNELDDALKSFQEAVKLDAQDVDSYYFEGVCYSEMKQYDQAIAILEKALDEHEDFGCDRLGLWRAGALLDCDSNRRDGEGTARDDPRDARSNADDRSSVGTEGECARVYWRRLHDGCHRIWRNGPGADAVGPASHRRIASQCEWKLRAGGC
jgi:tetratricopeptide (TPR) repeat protein